MKIAICSAFRNAERHVPRYFSQIAGLYLLLRARGDGLHLVLGEGDSTDQTRLLLTGNLRALGLAATGVDCTHGGPRFGHVQDARRFAQLAQVYNQIWAGIPADAHAVIFVEGDLIWQPQTMVALLDRLQDAAAVAPMVYHAAGCTRYGPATVRYFYDTWGFAAAGVNFSNRPPYHRCINGHPIPLDSAGSCIVMRAQAARRVCFPDADMVVGMTRHVGAPRCAGLAATAFVRGASQ